MASQIFAGKYIVQDEIARGGMGVIYRALDRTLNRIVAIKLVHAHLSGDASFVERFLREARAMARLQHDNIVSIYAVEEDQQTQFLVMEFCAGSNLRALIRHQPQLSLRDAIRVSHQLASALAYAHGQGIIHRDIKPANVLVDKKGKAKLTDFGIAAALDEASITMTGQVIGTPEYMSPEQARGLKLDGRSDLYSLGIMMYEMLTGRTPYAVSSKTSILGRLAYDQDELELNFPAHIPSLLQGVVRDLVRRNPEERISDADLLANQLHEILFTVAQTPAVSEAAESDATVVAPVHKQAPPLPVSPVDDRTIVSTDGKTKTSVAPGIPEPAKQPPSVPPRNAHPSPVLDETTVLPAQPHTSLGPPRETPSSPPRPPVSASPPAIRFLPWIGGGVALVLALAGLVYFLANYGDTSSGTLNQTASPPLVQVPNPNIGLIKKLDEREETMRRLDTLVRRATDQLKAERSTEKCATLKSMLLDTYNKFEDSVRAVNEARRKLDRDPLPVATKPDHLNLACERTKVLDAKVKPKPGVKDKGPIVTMPPSPPVPAPLPIPPQPDTNPETHPLPPISKTPTPTPPIQKPDPPESIPPLSTNAAFPDLQLRSLLDRFKQAYERHDFEAVQTLSTMNERRRANVEFMFANYTEFRALIENIAQTEEGATATLVLETGIRSNGEIIEIPPLSRKYSLKIPHGSDGWDRIKW